MLRKFLFIVFLFTISCRVPKTLEGEYFESFGAGWGGATYTFYPGGTFEYVARYDIGGLEGKGKYKINDRRLKLIFSGDSLSARTSEIRKTEYIRQDTSWEINVLVMQDTTNDPLAGALIIISDSLGKDLIGKTTDLNGKVTVPVIGYTGTLKVTARYIGMQVATTQLDHPGVYSLSAHLIFRSLFQPIPAGTLWKYRIVYYSPDDSFFNIKPRNSVTDGIGPTVKRLDKIFLHP
jgi:hypothetical protein